MSKRPQLYSEHAERCVVGTVLRASQVLGEHFDIGAEDFYSEALRLVFEAARAIYARRSAAVDVRSVAEHLSRSGMLEAVGTVSALQEHVAYAAEYASKASDYAKQAGVVRRFAMRRQGVALARQFEETISDPMCDMADAVAGYQRALGGILDRGSDKRSTLSTYAELIAAAGEIALNPRGNAGACLQVGISEIADMLSLERKLVYVIGGRPGTGKSALLQQILENIAGQGFGCIFPSLEMHNVQVGMRALAAESGIPFGAIKAGNVHNRGVITKAIETLSRLDIEVDERPRQTLAYIRQWVIRRKREGELGKRAPLFLVGIDYAQMLAATNPRLPRHEQIEEVSRGVKELAKEQDVAVILLAQLKRYADDSPDKPPTISDIAGSDALTRDADVIVLTHRNPADPKWKDRCEMIFGKVRDGQTGVRDVRFSGARYRFGGFAT